jgi:hypothetical protein
MTRNAPESKSPGGVCAGAERGEEHQGRNNSKPKPLNCSREFRLGHPTGSEGLPNTTKNQTTDENRTLSVHEITTILLQLPFSGAPIGNAISAELLEANRVRLVPAVGLEPTT